MNILLLNPIPLYETWPIPNDFWRCFTRVASCTFPQLASMVPGENVRILDGLVERVDLASYARILASTDIIGLSAVSAVTALNTEITIKFIKRLNPKATIVLGGHHASAYPLEWLSRGADIIIKHEGEETFRELIMCLKEGKSLSGVKGAVFKKDGEFHCNPERGFIESLDELPVPRWELMDFNRYRCLYDKGRPWAMIETSRGCKFHCTFCTASWMWNYRQRYKSIDRVVDELQLLYRLGARGIGIADDNFGSHYDRDAQILERIASLGFDLELWMFCRADTVLNNPHFVELAVRAGLREVVIGFESTREDEVKGYNKGLVNMEDLSCYQDVYRIFKKNNVLVFGAFMMDISTPGYFSRRSVLYQETCDIAMHQAFIPTRGIPEYEKLKTGFMQSGYDHFYSFRYVTPFRGLRFLKHFELSIRSIHGICNSNLIRLLVSGDVRNRRNRRSVINVLKTLVRCCMHISFNKFIDFVITTALFLSNEKKQRILVSRYTDVASIERLIKKACRGNNGHHSC